MHRNLLNARCKLELAAVPAALIAVTIATIMLSACVWLANNLNTVYVAK